MTIENDMLDFFPADIEPIDALSANRYCMRLPIAWVLSGRQAAEPGQWLADTCAYLEIPQGCEIAAVCTGYRQLRQEILSWHSLGSDEAREQLTQMLASLCKLQLAALDESDAAFPPLTALPELRDRAAELSFGLGHNETCLFYSVLLRVVLQGDWLSNMAMSQRRMYATFGEQEAETVGQLWQVMMAMLLPESLQTACFVENCVYYTTVALNNAWPEEENIWTAIANAFIETMNTEEPEQ